MKALRQVKAAPRKKERARIAVPRAIPFSDIDLSRWKEYEHVSTDSLWLIPAREKRAGHQLDYHGNFVPQIATQAFLRYTREGEIVVDFFLGAGTSAIEALRLGRRCIGVDIKRDLLEYVADKLPRGTVGKEIFLLHGDSASKAVELRIRDCLAQLGATQSQLIILHPPYHDIIKFSEEPGDLSNSESVEEFLRRFRSVAESAHRLLEDQRFAALVIGDAYAQGELIPLGFLCMQEMQRAGFTLKSIVVKNIEGNERGKGKASNLWRFRALAGGFYIFKHEYVIVFQKKANTKRAKSEGRR